MNRREFVGMTATGISLAARGRAEEKRFRMGVIGTGGRGRSLVSILMVMPDVDVPALCDVNKENLAKAVDMVLTAGRPKPEGYAGGPEDYKRLLDRDDLDGVLIATPWELHTPMAISAMKAKKVTGVEVPIAITVAECWQLLKTRDETGTQCMMLENWSFRRDNLAVLKMVRAGLFGEINYAHCAYAHDCNDEWFFNNGVPRWSATYLMTRNADQYPTHGLGPVLSWMDLNCGDYPAYLTATATRAISVNNHFRKKYGPEHPMAKQKFKQGDIVNTVIKTVQGKTIVVYNDMVSPRPYDNRWELSGTDGIYSQGHNAVYLEGVSPHEHAWDPFDPYQEKYDHHWHREAQALAGKLKIDEVSHGSPDYLEIRTFVDAAKEGKPLPLTLEDSILMSVPVPLSDESIAKGSAPVPFPDFTRGKWKTNKPYFALES